MDFFLCFFLIQVFLYHHNPIQRILGTLPPLATLDFLLAPTYHIDIDAKGALTEEESEVASNVRNEAVVVVDNILQAAFGRLTQQLTCR
jgi:hypothetical protein